MLPMLPRNALPVPIRAFCQSFAGDIHVASPAMADHTGQCQVGSLVVPRNRQAYTPQDYLTRVLSRVNNPKNDPQKITPRQKKHTES